jgi:hypothetical protein
VPHPPRALAGPSSAVHYPSHRELLQTDRRRYRRRPDAIVVPTTRGETHLAAALALGESLGVPVLVLHSPPGATQPFGPPGPTESTVVLTMAESRPALPDLETFRFFPNGSTSDLHQKRNVALAIAHVAGWRTLFFLDDDIDTPRPGDVMRAVASLDRYTAAGLPALRYPDNSIVCHANRLIGRKQDVFVGGAALAVNVDQADSFFPDLYNEDWALSCAASR